MNRKTLACAELVLKFRPVAMEVKRILVDLVS
jgi:hypothetical protein